MEEGGQTLAELGWKLSNWRQPACPGLELRPNSPQFVRNWMISQHDISKEKLKVKYHTVLIAASTNTGKTTWGHISTMCHLWGNWLGAVPRKYHHKRLIDGKGGWKKKAERNDWTKNTVRLLRPLSDTWTAYGTAKNVPEIVGVRLNWRQIYTME